MMITEGPNFNQVGWICPKCGMVINPNLSTCPNCNTNNSMNGMNPKCSCVSTTWENNNVQNGMICS